MKHGDGVGVWRSGLEHVVEAGAVDLGLAFGGNGAS